MKKKSILIVEDEVMIALQMKMNLLKEGFEVFDPLGRGEDAIDFVRRKNPDVILMDIRLLGEMDGIETARRIGEFSSAKIVFVTGHSDPDTQASALALKPAAFLVKPVEIDNLTVVLRNC